MSRMAPISAPYHLPVKSYEVNRKIPVKTPYHGFRLKSEQFDFGKKKGYHRKAHLKSSRMTQISAP